ncbi:MAG: hypothetical protein ACRC67_07245, partial [Inquilinus sp.]|uniref:hypothetical protein n=1 Tax=Inquilinus sp. TaxID=1932117 RepID=UPI003F40F3A8
MGGTPTPLNGIAWLGPLFAGPSFGALLCLPPAFQWRLGPEAVWKGVFGERGPGFVDVLLSKRVRQLRYQVRIAWSRPGTPR